MTVISCINIVWFATLLSTATSTLLCYDCDAGIECEDPIGYNVRSANCNKQYPEASENNLACLVLDITVPSMTRGFNLHKSGVYRGCRIINSEAESNYCETLALNYQSRLVINSCKYCNSTRCIP